MYTSRVGLLLIAVCTNVPIRCLLTQHCSVTVVLTSVAGRSMATEAVLQNGGTACMQGWEARTKPCLRSQRVLTVQSSTLKIPSVRCVARRDGDAK